MAGSNPLLFNCFYNLSLRITFRKEIHIEHDSQLDSKLRIRDPPHVVTASRNSYCENGPEDPFGTFKLKSKRRWVYLTQTVFIFFEEVCLSDSL